MTLSLTARLSLREDDPCLAELRRLTMSGERSTVALRRVLYRYADIMKNTGSSPGEIVRDLADVLVSSRVDLIGRVEYPLRDEVIKAVSESPIPEPIRRKLVKYIETINYAEYAKLIEAVELMYRS